jgi:hypothetical protein
VAHGGLADILDVLRIMSLDAWKQSTSSNYWNTARECKRTEPQQSFTHPSNMCIDVMRACFYASRKGLGMHATLNLWIDHYSSFALPLELVSL